MKQISRFRHLKNRYDSSPELRTDYEILSNNKVTGWSVNFPIVETCKPSKICAETCYGLSGPIIWSNSLNKQTRNLKRVQADPKEFALQLEKEVRKKLKKDPLFFIRWNGVGDLFDESIEALKILNKLVPELPVWCVTRIPEKVLPLKNIENIWIHFSLDRDSWERKTAVESLIGSDMKNIFFSYQTDKGERLDEIPTDISVLFFDRYKIPEASSFLKEEQSICPLNTNEDISNVCHSCRRCFNGDAVKMRVLD